MSLAVLQAAQLALLDEGTAGQGAWRVRPGASRLGAGVFLLKILKSSAKRRLPVAERLVLVPARRPMLPC